MKHAKGIMWLDDCRIPFVDGGWVRKYDENSVRDNPYHGVNGSTREGIVENSQGRFSPNLLVCDDMLNDGSVSKSGFNPKAKDKQYKGGNFGGGLTNDNGLDYGDKGTNSRYYDLDLWFEKMIEKL